MQRKRRWPRCILALAGSLSLAGPALAEAPAKVFKVSEAFHLLASIAPERSIELATSDYDLVEGALKLAALQKQDPGGGPPVSLGPHLEFHLDSYGATLRIHDVPGLRLIGPDHGVARIWASRTLAVTIEAAPRLGLAGLSFGRRIAPPWSAGYLGGDQSLRLAIVASPQASLEGLHFLPHGFSQLELKDSEARIHGLKSEGATLKVAGRSRVELEEVRADSPEGGWLEADSEAEVHFADVTISANLDELRSPAPPCSERPAPRGRTAGLRLFDRVTGRELKGPRSCLEPAQLPVELPLLRLRAPPSSDGDGGLDYVLRYRLPDGRSFEAGEVIDGHGLYGSDPGTFEASHLGGGQGPILITWQDDSQGSGANQNTYYHLLAPGPEGATLLSGEVNVSGHIGWAEGGQGGIEIGYEKDLLTLYQWRYTWNQYTSETGGPPPPGCLNVEGEENTRFCETFSRTETVYRWTGTKLEPASQAEFQLYDGSRDLKSQLQSWTPSLPHPDGEPVRPGDWLRKKP